jgi:DNA polymerase-3 subunit delta
MKAGVHLFYGPDTFSVSEAVRSLRRDLGVSEANVVRLDGRTATPHEIAAATQSASFFAETRLVIVEGLSTQFGGRRRSRSSSGRRRGSEAPESNLDGIIEVLSNLPETTIVALVEDQPSPAFVEALKGTARTGFFGIKKSEEVRRWADARFKERGGAISGQALSLLCEMVDGYHLGELAQEVDKLLAYTGGGLVEVQDVEEAGSGAVQHQTWDLTDAVVAGRADRALRVVQRMDEKQHPAQLLHSMIVRQYRQVLVAQTMLREGFTAQQIGERLGISHSFPLQKVIDQASRSPAGQLEQAFRRLLESDVAIKTGVMDVDTALELLIVELAQLANSGRRAGARAGR